MTHCYRHRAILSAIAGLLLATQTAWGQTATQEKPLDKSKEKPVPVVTVPATETPTDEEILVLSPFEVNVQKDVGFVAASGVSGSRLATEIRDTAVAYSVVNREMIEALGITDLNAAAEWTTNTQKFVDPAGGGDFFNITAPLQVRGVGNISQFRQRNFFYYFAPMDSSSIERYDFGRGPNSVLFGNGTIGGTQMSTTKRARLDRSFQTLSLNYGSWDSFRGEVDVNQPLGKKVALRIAGAYADKKGWRDFDMENTRNFFSTLTYKPTKKTEIRVDAETGRQARKTEPTVFREFFAGWDGRTVFNGTVTDPIRNGTAVNPGTGVALLRSTTLTALTGEPEGVDRRGTNYFVWDPASGQNAIMNYQNDPMTRAGSATARTPIGGFTQAYNPLLATTVNRPAFNAANSQLIYALDMPVGMYDTAINSSYFQLPGKSFSNGTKGPMIIQRYKDLQVSFNHQFGNSLFVELAGDMNRVNNKINQLDGRGLMDTYIDINRLLPNGAANPNYLRPYGDATITDTTQVKDADSVRAALAYIKDAGKWGNYSVNAMGGYVFQNQTGIGRVLSVKQNADQRNWGNTDVLRQRLYWNSDAGRDYDPITKPITYIDPMTGTTRTITPDWVYNNVGDNTATTWAKNKYQYALAALSAKYFKGRWVVMAAGRYDHYLSQVRYPVNAGDFPLDWDGHSIIWRPDAPADYMDLTYWRRTSAGVPTGNAAVSADTRPRVVLNRDPLYANDRFRNDYNPPKLDAGKTTYNVGTVVHPTKWLSLFTDRAESFTLPNAATPTITGEILPPVEASGWDAGMRLFLWKEKINITVTKYHNLESGSYEQPAATTGNINGIWGANAIGDNSTDGRNVRGFMDIVGGSQDVRERLAEGYEFEMIANITDGWRVTLNVGLPKVYVMNRFPITRAYLKQHEADFIQVLQDAGGALDTTQHPNGAPGLAYAATLPTGTIARDQAQAVTNYNNLYINASNIVTGKQLANDQKNMNLYTDYTFKTGRLKGFKVGVGAQYRGQLVVGYRGADTIVDPNNSTLAIDDPTVSAYTPVKVPGRITYRAVFGYSYRMKNRRELIFNLAIMNLLNERNIIYVDPTVQRPKNGDYSSPAREAVAQRASYMDPVSFNLTTTIKL
jgi:outer membrane receptor protein involved in Fe transport